MSTSSQRNFLTCGNVRSLPAADQFFSYAVAYLDSAQRLCSILARSPRKASFERGAVTLHLTSHAVELFLKGAILRKAPTERFSHDLEHLYSRYTALYPGKKFALTNQPFRTEFPGMSKAVIAAAKVEVPPTSELYRYPVSKGGEPWVAALAFEPTTYVTQLATLRKGLRSLASGV